MTAEPRLTIAFTGVDSFRAAWHHGQPGPHDLTSAAPDPSHGSATVVDGSGTGAVQRPGGRTGARRGRGNPAPRGSTAPTSTAGGA